MWSVSPAAIAGIQGRHTLAEPVPLVGVEHRQLMLQAILTLA